MTWFERFVGIGTEGHRQVYRAVREYPLAILHTAIVALNLGLLIGVGIMLIRNGGF